MDINLTSNKTSKECLKVTALWLFFVVLLNPLRMSLETVALIGGGVPTEEILDRIDILGAYLYPWAYLFPNFGMVVILLWPIMIKRKPEVELSLKNVLLAIITMLGIIYLCMTFYSLTDISRWPVFWGYGIDYIEVWPPKYYMIIFALVAIQIVIPRIFFKFLSPGVYQNTPNESSKSMPKDGAI